MARIVQRTEINLTALVELSSAEIDAIGYLADYANDAVVKAIGKHVSGVWEANHGAAFAAFMKSVGGQFSTLKKQREEMTELLAGRGRFKDLRELKRDSDILERVTRERDEARARLEEYEPKKPAAE